MKKQKLYKIIFYKEIVRSLKCFFGNKIILKTVFIFITLILCIGIFNSILNYNIGIYNLDFMVYVFLVAIGLALLTELFKIKK